MLIDLRNAVNRKEIPKNENSEEVIDIVEEILHSHFTFRFRACFEQGVP